MTVFRLSALGLLVSAGLVSACAPLPRNIIPVAVSARDFDQMSCEEIAAARADNARNLEEAVKVQRGAVVADTIGVAAILVPPTAFTGDRRADIAVAKGNEIALARSLEQKHRAG